MYDGVAELADDARRLAEALHANAVRRVGAESRQHGVTHARAVDDVVPLIVGTMFAMRRHVHVETVDHASVTAVLMQYTRVSLTTRDGPIMMLMLSYRKLQYQG